MTSAERAGSPVSRRGFVSAAGTTGLMAAAVTATGFAGSATAQASEVPESFPETPAAALRMMMRGNERFVHGKARHPHQSVRRREHVAPHQDPFATVFSCIDSRVPPEIVFDRGLGDFFVIRTGAQSLDAHVVLGSIEFGPNAYPSARLIFVLGHQSCGAVLATIDVIKSGKPAPGHIQAVVNALRPAYQVAIQQAGDLVDNMVRAQTRLTVERLKRDHLLRKLIENEGLKIVGGHYSLDSGKVHLIA